MDETENTPTKEDYLKSLHERLQNSIVNYKSCDSSSNVDLIWTYKTTYCDVLSAVTTSKPFGIGCMKDIKLRNKEMKRYDKYSDYFNIIFVLKIYNITMVKN
jgi:hypothetical protein